MSVAIAAPDLFGSPIPGLASVESLVSPDEEVELIARIDDEQLMPFRFQGWLGKRVTRSFGWAYDFDNGSFAKAVRSRTGWQACAPRQQSSPAWRPPISFKRC